MFFNIEVEILGPIMWSRNNTLRAAVQRALMDRHTMQPLRRGDFAHTDVEAVGTFGLLLRGACAGPSWPRSLVRDTMEAALALAEE